MDNRTIRLSDAIEAAPCTARKPRANAYDSGYFDAIIAYQKALSAPPAVEGWLDIDDDTPANQTLILGWRDWRDATWCTEIAPYQTGQRVGAYSSVSCHGSATHYLPLSILPAPPIE